MIINIGKHSRDKYVSESLKEWLKNEDINKLVQSGAINEKQVSVPINIIAGCVFRTLNYNEGDSLNQYLMSKRLRHVLNYTEEEYEAKKHLFIPEGFFMSVNCFTDRVKPYINSQMKPYKVEFPTLDLEQEKIYLDFISQMTEQSVTELTNIFESENVLKQTKLQYERAIQGKNIASDKTVTWADRVQTTPRTATPSPSPNSSPESQERTN